MAQSKPMMWISPTFGNPDIMQHLHAYPDMDLGSPEAKRFSAIMEMYVRGEPIPDDELPKRFYGSYKETRIKAQLNFFGAQWFLCVSEAFASVLRQFNLGHDLHPVEIWQGNRKTQIEGPFYILTFSLKKQAFLPSLSDLSGLRQIRRPPSPLWSAANWVEDGDAVLSSLALEKGDLWLDPLISGAFFLSDKLVQALREKKLTRTLRQRKCRIVESLEGMK